MYTTTLCPFIKAATISADFRDTKFELNKTTHTKLLNTLSKPFEDFGNFQAIGMICPRPCMVQVRQNDPIFDIVKARVEAETAGFFYEKLGIKDKFEFLEHPGSHEFEIKSIFVFFDKYLK